MKRWHWSLTITAAIWAASTGGMAAAEEATVSETHGDVEVVSTGQFKPRDLWFQSRVQVNATCSAVYDQLTQLQRFQGLIPHLHGKPEGGITVAKNPGDTIHYEFERSDGSKASGRFVVTELVEDQRGSMLVIPEDGPWLRVQEIRLYAPAGEGGDAKPECHALYEETYNPRWLENVAYDMDSIIKDVRAPYMKIILRRLKNLAEGKKPGPPEEVEKLRETAKQFP